MERSRRDATLRVRVATLEVERIYVRYMRTRATAKRSVTAPLRSSRRPSQAQISCCSSSMLVEKACCVWTYARCRSSLAYERSL